MKYTAQQIKFDLEKHHQDVLPYFIVEAKDRKYQFWKRNALPIDIMSSDVFIQKLNYIHKNPIRPNLCKTKTDYKYSSAKHYMNMTTNLIF